MAATDFIIQFSSVLNGDSPAVPGKNTITLQQLTYDNSTSLRLTGMGVASYGQDQQNNFIHLLENFASSTPPNNPTVGQTWYNPSTDVMSTFSEAGWAPITKFATLAEAEAGIITTKAINPNTLVATIQANALTFVPVQQGGSAGMDANTKLNIGYSTGSSTLLLQAGSTNYGGTWPINISGVATTATIATMSNSLNSANSYTGVNFTASGEFIGPGTGLTGTAASLNIGGNAATTTLVAVGAASISTNYPVVLSTQNGSGEQSMLVDSSGSLMWNPSANVMTVNGTINATGFTGALTGLASEASTLNLSGTAGTFHWQGQGGQPTWLWGGNAPADQYVYNPANFSVSHATTADNGGVTSVNGLTGDVTVSTTVGGAIASSNGYTGTHTATNSSGYAQFYTVFGGSNPDAGGTNANTVELNASVNGIVVANFTDNSSADAKGAFISFMVPPGGNVSISSNPYNAGSGTYTVVIYQF